MSIETLMMNANTLKGNSSSQIKDIIKFVYKYEKLLELSINLVRDIKADVKDNESAYSTLTRFAKSVEEIAVKM